VTFWFQVLAALMLFSGGASGQYGYSYSSFSGPVSGEIREVPVANHYSSHPHAASTHHHPSYNAKVDYVVSISASTSFVIKDGCLV
jgi:hypothetical protein